MKKIISALFLCMLFSAVPELQAQNIQLHYDFGRSLYDKDLKGRPLLTSTVEKFHPGEVPTSLSIWTIRPKESLPLTGR